MSLIIEAPSNEGRRKLKRTMGLWTATALVVGNMVGSGVPPSGDPRGHGPAGLDPRLS